jgi:hypothetical protein
MHTGDRLLPILGVGQEHVKALVTIVTDKVIGRHTPILTESVVVVERSNFVHEMIKYSCHVVLVLPLSISMNDLSRINYRSYCGTL